MPDTLLLLATWCALALELLFAPLALSRRLRPYIWSAMLAMHAGLIVLIDFADLSVGMVFVHLFTFDPSWVRVVRGERRETIYYDGSCGLCHRAVRFVLAEDRDGSAFDFAPLQGVTFADRLPEERRRDLPDSIVVETSAGALLTRSRAALHILVRLGGGWRVLASTLRLVPRAAADLAYDAIATIRLRLFAKPSDACPLLPPEMRKRFLP